MRPVKTLFVSHGSGLGGAERVLLELIDGLDRNVVEPAIVAPESGGLAEAARARAVPVFIQPAPWWLPFDWLPEPAYLFRRYWEEAPGFVEPLAALIRREQFDLVYSCSSPILHAALAAHLTRRPHLQHMQDLLGFPHLGFHMPFGSARFAYRLLGRLSSLVVCVGRTMREDIGRAIPAPKCRIVPLGFTPSPTQNGPATILPPRRAGEVRVGIAGMVDRRKGSDVIARIVQRTAAEDARVHFFWAGPGDPDRMARIAADTIIDGVPHLHFIGFTDRVHDFMQSIDFLLHPARNETFPRVLLEAGMAGRATVVTNCGGGPEIVEHGVSGLVAPVDDAEAIARAVSSLAKDQERARRMGAAARAFALKFDMASFQAGMQQALLDAHRRGPALRGALQARAVTGAMRLPSRLVPPLRRWAAGRRRLDAHP